MNAADIQPLAAPASLLGESPMWHHGDQCLYWCDIPGHALHRFDAASGVHKSWPFDIDVACCAAVRGGGLLLALRDGLWRFDPESGHRTRLADPPYNQTRERFNDGKVDPQGRLWVGTIYEPREPALAALYRFDGRALQRMADGITVSNGLGWSPDGKVMYWSDTKAHSVYAFDFDAASGGITNRRVFASRQPKHAEQPLDDYGGRPDGAAVDTAGCYWSAMFEGARVVRFSPAGEVMAEIRLPARCPTMPCFGGADLKTLYITTARENRPADELARWPWSGRVLQLRVDVPGLPTNLAELPTA